MQRYSSPLRSPSLLPAETSIPMYIYVIIIILVVLTVVMLYFLLTKEDCPKETKARCLKLFGPSGTLSQGLMEADVLLPMEDEVDMEAVEEGMCMSCSG